MVDLFLEAISLRHKLCYSTLNFSAKLETLKRTP